MKLTTTITSIALLLASAAAFSIPESAEGRLDAWLEMLNDQIEQDASSNLPMAKRAEGAFSPAVMSRHLNLLSRYGNGGRFGGGSTRFGR